MGMVAATIITQQIISCVAIQNNWMVPVLTIYIVPDRALWEDLNSVVCERPSSYATWVKRYRAKTAFENCSAAARRLACDSEPGGFVTAS